MDYTARTKARQDVQDSGRERRTDEYALGKVNVKIFSSFVCVPYYLYLELIARNVVERESLYGHWYAAEAASIPTSNSGV